jgi:polyisoprenoid-binding protein YceI
VEEEGTKTMSDPTSEEAITVYQDPEPGRWTIDAVHSFVSFKVLHMNVSYARGVAVGPTGTITIAPDLLESTVEATIDASTLTTLNPVRDAKMHGPELLDVERYPTIGFVSTILRSSAQNRYELGGQLTIHGVTKDVLLDLVFNGVVIDTWGKRRLGVTASTELYRDDFGAGEWGHVLLPGGGFMVPHHLKVTLDIEATKDEEEAA